VRVFFYINMNKKLSPKMYEHLIDMLQEQIKDLNKEVSRLRDDKYYLEDELEKQYKRKGK